MRDDLIRTSASLPSDVLLDTDAIARKWKRTRSSVIKEALELFIRVQVEAGNIPENELSTYRKGE